MCLCDIYLSQQQETTSQHDQGGDSLIEKDKTVLPDLADATNLFLGQAGEGTVLAITASYLAGKEAGKREAQAENQPG